MKKIDFLVNKLVCYNDAYRKGKSLVSDLEYDKTIELLRGLDSDNLFLNRVEREKFTGKAKIFHSYSMLSIEKVYDFFELKNFVKRVEKEANDIGIFDITFKVTAKLDGLAGKDIKGKLISRGNGKYGYDISDVFRKGVIPVGGRGRGFGEIVVVKSYFEKYMSNFFEHPRNMVVSIISSGKSSIVVKRALDDKKIHFIPYSLMKSLLFTKQKILRYYKILHTIFLKSVDYPIDGLVIEAVSNVLRNLMGATTHHHRWQIALKNRGKGIKALVKKIDWQIGRSGKITPVIQVDPIRISGAIIKRVTAYHAGNITKLRIGIGSKIKIIRSGEVIPKIESVIKPVDSVSTPIFCPFCKKKLNWKKEILKCSNYYCIARMKQRLLYWFKTLGNTEWVGMETIYKIIDAGYLKLELLYSLDYEIFRCIGFGKIQSYNFINSIHQSFVTPLNDWRFLAALSIPGLGLSDSLKILKKIKIYDIININNEFISKIYGFGDKTSNIIEKGILRVKKNICRLLLMNFKLIVSFDVAKVISDKGSFYGKKLVFTGKLINYSRIELVDIGIRFGYKVQKKVSKNTDYLISGLNASKSKLNEADRKRIEILSEKQYIVLLNNKF